MTKGGADFAFEAVGVPTLLEKAFYCLAPRGTAVLVSAIPDFAALHPGDERPSARCHRATRQQRTMHFHRNLRPQGLPRASMP